MISVQFKCAVCKSMLAESQEQETLMDAELFILTTAVPPSCQRHVLMVRTMDTTSAWKAYTPWKDYPWRQVRA